MPKRTLAFVFVGVLLAATALPLLVSAGTAEATVHPFVQSECAKNESQTGAGQNQDPPGQTPGATPGQGALKAVNALLANGALILVDPGADFPATAVWAGPTYKAQGEFHCTNPEAPNTHPD